MEQTPKSVLGSIKKYESSLIQEKKYFQRVELRQKLLEKTQSKLSQIQTQKNQLEKELSDINLLQLIKSNQLPSFSINTNEYKGFFPMENIVCKDSNNNITEQYGVIFIAEQPIKDQKGKIITDLTPYNAILEAEQDNLSFNPSSALTCNLLAEAFHLKNTNSKAKAFLDQYKDGGDGCGWHTLNTIEHYNGKNSQIIHYPQDSDFPQKHNQNKNINSKLQPIILPFNPKNLEDSELSQVLKEADTNTINFIKNWTGREDPEIMVSIAKCFEKTPRIWFAFNPSEIESVRGGWLGCDGGGFDLGAIGGLYGRSAARRVLQNFSTGNKG